MDQPQIINQLERIEQAIACVRCGAADTEEELHRQVGAALTAAGFSPVHEARLGPRCRIDFMADGIGIEIKKNRPQPSRLREQLARYAACDQVQALVVAAPRGVNLPAAIGGKRVVMVALERLWGVSLP